MRSPMLYTIRQTVIEGRKQTQGKKGRPIHIPTLGIAGRLLEHPSHAPHYVAIRPADSGAWRSQKTLELVKSSGREVWSSSLIGKIPDSVPEPWIGQLNSFLEIVFTEEIASIWLDRDFEFWSTQWSNWFFIYVSEGGFEQFIGRGTAFRRGIPVYTGVCSGGITND